MFGYGLKCCYYYRSNSAISRHCRSNNTNNIIVLVIKSFHVGRYSHKNYWDSLNKTLNQSKNASSENKNSPETFTRLNAQEASLYKNLPTSARMLVGDFIHDSLYNPYYGYFSKEAYIFALKKPIRFSDIKDSYAFMNVISNLYKEAEESNLNSTAFPRQVWHTPTELFKVLINQLTCLMIYLYRSIYFLIFPFPIYRVLFIQILNMT